MECNRAERVVRTKAVENTVRTGAVGNARACVSDGYPCAFAHVGRENLVTINTELQKITKKVGARPNQIRTCQKLSLDGAGKFWVEF